VRKKQNDKVRAPGSNGEPDEPTYVKKSRATLQLMMEKCVYMEESDVKKLNKEEIKVMRKLYEDAFGGLYK